MKTPIYSSKGRPIVAICIGALGDFVLTLPFLDSVAAGAPLIIVSRGTYRALVPEHWQVLHFVDVESSGGARLFGGEAPQCLRETARGATVHAFLKRDPLVAGALNQFHPESVTWHDPRPARPPHIVERFFLEAHRDPPAGILDIPVMPTTAQGRSLWIHPGSGSPAKNCPLHVFAALAKGWQQHHQAPVIVSIGEAEMALQDPCRACFADAGIHTEWVICPPLRELKERLAAEACMFIGNDSGVGHLAAALGIPVVACFRATDPRVWRPVGKCVVLPNRIG